MRRTVLTLVGLAIIGCAAILLGSSFLTPGKEKRDASREVLTGAYKPRLEECVILEDSELPPGIDPPAIGSRDRYVRVLVLFPGAQTIPGKGDDYHLDRVNGDPELRVPPVHGSVEVDDAGALLTLVYLADDGFEHARLVRGQDVVFDVSLE